MKETTSTYKQIIASGNTRNFNIKIEMTLADGTVFDGEDGHNPPFTEADIMEFKITTASSGDSTFDIGSAIIGKCEFTLNNFYDTYTNYDFFNATAVVWVKLVGDSQYYRMGFYTVDEPTFAGSLVKLEMLDNMWKFDIPLEEANVSFPCSCLQAVQDMCYACGVQLATQRFHGYDFEISEPTNAMNCRELLQYIAMIGCNFCVMDDQGNLNIRWYNSVASVPSDLDGGTFDTNTTPYSDGDSADGGDFTTYSSLITYDGGSFTEPQVSFFTRLMQRNIGTDRITITGVKFVLNNVDYQIGRNGYVLTLENPLVNESNVSVVLNLIWNVLYGFTFRIFKVTALPDLAPEVGDYCAISYKGATVYSYLSNYTFTPSLSTASLGAETPNRKLTTRYSKTVQTALDSAKEQTKEIISDYDLTVQMMNNLAVNAMGAYQMSEETPTGGRIYYLSNAPITTDSLGIKFTEHSVVFKMSGDGFFVSQDCGLRPASTTFVNGYNAQTGQLVINVLNAIGISAEWVKTGTLDVGGSGSNAVIRVRDANNVPVCYINTDGITMYRGALQSADGNNYINLTTNEVRLAATTTVGGQTVQSIVDSAQQDAEDYADTILSAAVGNINSEIEDLQDQIDGNVTTWYYSGVPTLSNLPASQWTTTTDKDNHIGDIYYDSATGYAYRFMKDGNNYVWTKISDSDIEAALSEAQDAWDLADHKRRVFISQPVPPYDLGDLWVQGSGGDIKRCATAKTSSQTYSSSDWVLASKYTDDTAVNNLDNSLNQQEVYNRLTNNSQNEGIFLNNGHLYLNASMIGAGKINADLIQGGTILLGGDDNYNGVLYSMMIDEDDSVSDYTILPSGSAFLSITGNPVAVKYYITIKSPSIEGNLAKLRVDTETIAYLKSGLNVLPAIELTPQNSVIIDNLINDDIVIDIICTIPAVVIDDKGINSIGGRIGDMTLENGELYDKSTYYIGRQDRKILFTRRAKTSTLTTFRPYSFYIKDSSFKVTFKYKNSTTTTRTIELLLQQYVGGTYTTISTYNLSNGIGTHTLEINNTFSNNDTNKYRLRLSVNAVSTTSNFDITYSFYIDDVTSVSISKDGIWGNFYGSLKGIADLDSAQIDDLSINGSEIRTLGVDDAISLSPDGLACNKADGSYANLNSAGLTCEIEGDTNQRVEIRNYGIELYSASNSYVEVNTGSLYLRIDSSNYCQFTRTAIKAQRNGTNYEVQWTASDRRFKEEIELLDIELSKNLIEATEPKKFKYKDTDGKHYGMIAQEVRKVLDSLGEYDATLEHSMGVGEESEVDDPRNISYQEYIPHLINYVKDLRDELNQVKAELKSLKGE